MAQILPFISRSSLFAPDVTLAMMRSISAGSVVERNSSMWRSNPFAYFYARLAHALMLGFALGLADVKSLVYHCHPIGSQL